MSITPRSVVISGGCGVLGQAFVKALTPLGFDCIILDTKKPTNSSEGHFICCDITGDISELDAYLHTYHGHVFGLINNASPKPPGINNELEDYNLQTFKDIIDVNLIGSYQLTKCVLPYLKKNKKGSIINIASIQGVVAPTFDMYTDTNITTPLSYSVAKAGLIHFCKWVATKYGNYNIRCNSISPGGVQEHQLGGDDFFKKYAKRTPLKSMATAKNVSDAVIFLMSEQSSYITGHNLVVDGGWTIY